jgi:hypothetical protein
MTPPPDSHLTDALLTLERFAHSIGTTTDVLLSVAATALADHIKQTGELNLPLQIGLPSQQCSYCPFGHNHPPKDLPLNVIPGDWE